MILIPCLFSARLFDTTASSIEVQGLELQGLSGIEKEAVKTHLTKYSDVFAKHDSDLYKFN